MVSSERWWWLGGGGAMNARVIDENVQLAARQPDDLVSARIDAALVCHIERQTRIPGFALEFSQDSRIASRCDNMQT